MHLPLLPQKTPSPSALIRSSDVLPSEAPTSRITGFFPRYRSNRNRLDCSWRPGRVVLKVVRNLKHDIAAETACGERPDNSCASGRGSSYASDKRATYVGQPARLSLTGDLICSFFQFFQSVHHA